jgi:hypothetical protein
MEEILRNITLALYAEPLLLATESNIATDLEVSRYEIVYFYDWQRLAMSYCIALLLAFTAVIGLYTILSTRQSYSNNSSTITLRPWRFDRRA